MFVPTLEWQTCQEPVATPDPPATAADSDQTCRWCGIPKHLLLAWGCCTKIGGVFLQTRWTEGAGSWYLELKLMHPRISRLPWVTGVLPTDACAKDWWGAPNGSSLTVKCQPGLCLAALETSRTICCTCRKVRTARSR